MRVTNRLDVGVQRGSHDRVAILQSLSEARAHLNTLVCFAGGARPSPSHSQPVPATVGSEPLPARSLAPLPRSPLKSMPMTLTARPIHG